MQYNKMCLICYVDAYHYKLNVNVNINVNADKCNKRAIVSQIKERSVCMHGSRARVAQNLHARQSFFHFKLSRMRIADCRACRF